MCLTSNTISFCYMKKAIYCSQRCLELNMSQFHWAECGLLNQLQDEDIGHMALMVYRILVRTGLQTLLDVSSGDIDKTSKNAVYDSNFRRAN